MRKNKTIGRTQQIQEYPISIFLDQRFAVSLNISLKISYFLLLFNLIFQKFTANEVFTNVWVIWEDSKNWSLISNNFTN